MTGRIRGFSLTEMLVVLGIIVIAVGILLPVIDNARRTARGAQCLSNLNQLGIATHSYLTDQTRFPAGAMLSNGKTASPQALLMSYLSTGVPAGDVFGTDDALRDAALQRESASLLCPSEKAPRGAAGGRTSYRGSAGVKFAWAPEGGDPATHPRKGVFSPVEHGLKLEEVKDGASVTAVFSEHPLGDRTRLRVTGQSDYFKIEVAESDTADAVRQKLLDVNPKRAEQRSEGGSPWGYADDYTTLYSHDALPGEFSGWWGDDAASSYVTAANSMHGKGANIVMADGSTRWVARSMDEKTWRSLGTFGGGEGVGSY